MNFSRLIILFFLSLACQVSIAQFGSMGGGGDDIRGYTNGKYRADQVYSLQAEYRWNFYKRFGMVAFMAVATAVNDLSEMTLDGFLPGAGAGIRYMMIKDEQINVGMDIATGKDDWGIYFRISEAF